MPLLLAFGFLAGGATALSPCVLPILPAVLAGGTTGGRRRPLGIVVGLTATFTFATVALVAVLDAFGLPDDLLRRLAIVVLAGFGLVLLLPAVAARLEARLSRLAAAAAPRRRAADGWWSGLALGAGLGILYAPCAGPILAAVITTSAAQPLSADRLAVALAYGAGTGVVLHLLMLGGRRLTRPLSRRSGRFQQAMGAVMVALAVAMVADLDLRFQTAIADELPAAIVTPTAGLERSGAIRDALADLRGGEHGRGPGGSPRNIGPAAVAAGARLPDLGAAPEIVGTQRWFNVPGGRPLSLADLRGRVVLLDFWTFSCINCLRTLPGLRQLDARYRRAGLTIVGVHAPEFPFERSADDVAAAIRRTGIRYPVVQDNRLATWTAWGTQYWPSSYLVDARGHVRWAHAGEGAEDAKEQAVRALLAEAGRPLPAVEGGFRVPTADPRTTTPETYLGALRIRSVLRDTAAGRHRYPPLPADLPPDSLALAGRWRLEPERAVAGAGARIGLRFRARRVYLVLAGPRGAAVDVRLDGRRPGPGAAGADVRDGRVRVGERRLYDLLDLPAVADGRLELRLPAGVAGYAFTFG